MPREVLRSLLHAYRRAHQPTTERLIWTTPGVVWAMDFTELEPPIDGTFGAVLSVRDLASTCQLAALPVTEQTASVAAALLAELFAVHGPPLVLKTDNGAHFIAQIVDSLLQAAEVAHLRSPPATPRYNGAIEAGIGALKTRLHHVAAAHGRPAGPTCDDLEEARLEANAEARPWGPNGPSPEQRWNSRPPITAEQRAAFQAAVAAAHLEDTRRLPRQRAASQASTSSDQLDTNDRATVARRSIRRALVEPGFLITRRTATSSTDLSSVVSKN